MYQALLTRRYLVSKIMPLIAAVAVALCTAMVLIVWSVMGGFLAQLLASGKSMIGDVSIVWPVEAGGIPHYAQLIERLRAHPSVAAATPTIETPGLVGLDTGERRMVLLIGVEPEGYDSVTGYSERIYWTPLAEPLPKDVERLDPRLKLSADYESAGRTMVEPDQETGEPRPAVVPGIEVTHYNARTEAGFVEPQYGFFGPEREVTLTVLPMSSRGVAIDVSAKRFPIANEFRTGLYDADANWVLVPLNDLQRMLALDEGQRTAEDFQHGVIRLDEQGNEFIEPALVTEVEPAKVTTVLVKAAAGVKPIDLRRACEGVYAEFAAAHPEGRVPRPSRVLIYTWEEKPGLRMFISAVKKETALVLVLFGIISLVAVVLIFSIFWSMVSEKTKDVGILRAIGASRAGIAWLYLRFGLAIGAVGALVGGSLAWLIVTYINPIHEWLGQAMGITVWDPKVYYFSTIPNRVEPEKAAIVLGCALVFSVTGALIPAVRAAFMDPVRALRFE